MPAVVHMAKSRGDAGHLEEAEGCVLWSSRAHLAQPSAGLAKTPSLQAKGGRLPGELSLVPSHCLLGLRNLNGGWSQAPCSLRDSQAGSGDVAGRVLLAEICLFSQAWALVGGHSQAEGSDCPPAPSQASGHKLMFGTLSQ